MCVLGSNSLNPNNVVQHCFYKKMVAIPENCSACEKRIKFGKTSIRCKCCKLMYHTSCKDMIPPLCLNRANLKDLVYKSESVQYYAPLETPMIPALVITCIEEIERRGLIEKGLYSIQENKEDINGMWFQYQNLHIY